MLSKAAQLSELMRAEKPATIKSMSMRKPVLGVGVNDAPYDVGRGKSVCPAYRQWSNMLGRCYNAAALERNPTYNNCAVSPEWLAFMAFREWWIGNHVDGFGLDKDLLILGNRMYGPSLCVFVPHSINTFLADCGSSRGEWPIGVCFDVGRARFMARCSNNEGKDVYLGRFECQVTAHMAWQRFKLGVLEGLRAEMDAIDPRIYVNAKAKILSYAECLNL